MPDLEPITRDEKLWSGEDLEPITRREMYIKHLYDETQVIPDKPITREEMFILKAGEELHDVTIEQLTATENRTYSEEGVAYSPVIVNVPQTTLTTLDVTENGTYTAPSGTAYDEVEVDVPLPDNAYLLKEIEDVEIATFTDGSALPMPKLEVAVEPQQDLHGYDAPWVGGAGKNKFDYDTVYTSYKQSDGSFRLTANNAVSIKNYIPQDLLNKQLTFSVYVDLSKETSPNYIRTIAEVGGSLVSGTDVSSGNKGYISVTFTPTSTDDFFYFTYGSGGNNYFTMNDIMLEVSSTRTTFAPYENECPIIGWSAVDVTRCGKNWLPTGRGYNFPYNADVGTVLDVDTDTADWIDDENGEYEVTLSDWQRCGLLSNQLPIGETAYVRIKIVSGSPRVSTYTLDADYRVIRKFSNYNPASDGLDYNTQIQLAENERYVGVAIVGSNKKVIISKPHIVLNTDEPYEPYNGQTITIQLGDTYYGGKLDVVSGVLTVDKGYVIYDGSSDENWAKMGSTSASAFAMCIDSPFVYMITDVNQVKCNFLKTILSNATWGNEDNWVSYTVVGGIAKLCTGIQSITEVEDWKTYLSSNNLQVVYELATPTTIQLSPTQVNSLMGVNNIFADCGKIINGQYFSKGE